MRDIKFRGKDKENWHYGDLVREIRHHDNKLFNGTIIHIRNFEYKNGDYVGDIFPVNPETVGQYTGLKDIHGVEIYEGDIVLIGNHFKALVKYSDVYAEYMIISTNSIAYECESLADYIDSTEVLGNKHDNPELLGGE